MDSVISGMKKMDRRKFITHTAGTAVMAAGLSSFINMNAVAEKKPGFIHHVYFWLNKAESKEDLQSLIKGLEALSKIDYIRFSHIGVPAGTSRDVIDSSYSVSWLLFFNDKAEEERYQKDPLHLKFIEDCKHLWKKVVVYDTVGI
jgi:Stress responsive A/B Barrel Domain